MRLSSWKPTFGMTTTALALAGLLAVPGLEAQQAGEQTTTLPALQTSRPTQRIVLEAGKSTVLETAFDVTRVLLTNNEVAAALAVAPREVAIQALAPGTISMIVWGEGRREHYELVVDPGIAQLEQALDTLFPGEDVHVTVNEGAVILSGSVSNNEAMLRIGEIAAASAPAAKLINMLQLPGGSGSQQVMLQVRVAEVNRRAVHELGLSLFVSRDNFLARSTTQQFPAPDFAGDELTFSDFLNVFFFQRNEGIGGVLKALEQNGWFETLAEPNLIAYNGQEATFLAGGEFPIPFVAGAGGQVAVQFREYGVRLSFTPTIAGDVIRLSVDPEVSALDFNNGVSIGGFRIPALTTRKAHTVVELRDGQSFAIAGLLNTTNQEDKAYIPLLARIPIIGNLFRTRASREEQTELMVLITPRLVRPLNPDEVPPLPTIIREPGRGGGRGGGGGGDIGGQLMGAGGLVDAPMRARGGGGR
jgi:pilus assembly protein CpaC